MTLDAGVCRFCGCMEHTPCDGGCAWTDDSRTLCTTCLGAAAIGIELVKAVGVAAAIPTHGLHVAVGDWDALDLDRQRTIVMTIRTWLTAVELQIAGEFDERAIANGEELDALAAFLLEKCPEELSRVPDAPLAAVVIRLLEPHVGSRIVLPGARR